MSAVLAAVAISCGSGMVDSPELPAAEGIQMDLTVDVRDALIHHFAARSNKPPAGARPDPNVYRFDYLETARNVTQEGEGIVVGQYLFSVNDAEPFEGTIEVGFMHDGSGWIRTGQVSVASAPVSPSLIAARVLDSNTGLPLEGVAVSASRVDDALRGSRHVRSDDAGAAVLEVLSGTFRVSAEHPEFVPLADPTVLTQGARLEVQAIEMEPTGEGVRAKGKLRIVP